MRIVYIIFLASFLKCFSQSTESKLTVTISRDSILNHQKKTQTLKEGMFKININLEDNPVWVWGKYDHKLLFQGINYDHIYGINYIEEDGSVKTLYYEVDRESNKNDSINFSNASITPYPGDKTLQVVDTKSGDQFLLFNVLENKDFRRTFKGKEFKRIPTVNMNNQNEKVSDYEVELNIAHKKGRFYEIIIIHSGGINTYIFKSNNDLKESDLDLISYFDLISGRIYLLDKNFYLEKTDI